MLNFQKKSNDTELDAAISTILDDMKVMEVDSEAYAKAVDQLSKLMKLKKEVVHSWRPSPDAVVTAAGSLLGILLILNFEKAGVITSKALSFVGRMK